MSCTDCLCRYCLRFWQGRCPHGECYDDYRAKTDPYTAHKPERHTWTDSQKPGEQAHWCRGGALYPITECEQYIEYEGSHIEECVKANIQVFQDGLRTCSMMVNGSCEMCLRELEKRKRGEAKG